MFFWFVVAYVTFVAVLVAYSAHVAISCPDAQKRADAYKVLRLIWAAGTSVGGLTAAVFNIMVRLHEMGAI
ncbi:hypothetical protein [Nocardia wallacei]|uniref:hypothetical protein n=1 Tax=Nocardia wallacei TaxID=480035 RepID=UPI002454F837|nr:hypothetical protein [Nocardia wallacei]